MQRSSRLVRSRSMQQRTVRAIAAIAGALLAGHAYADIPPPPPPPAPPPGAIQHPVESMPWAPAPPSMPAGTQIVVLEGDPKAPGLFTLRLRVPAGSRIEPHTHPRNERVTVISGAAQVGFGEEFDGRLLRTLHAGSYYVNPQGVPHFLRFAVETVVQVTAEGPWELHFVDK